MVMLSPCAPESLYEARTGIEGGAGGTVSTEKLKGVTEPEFGASSFPVRTWAPSVSGLVVKIQTLLKPLERNVPIEAPSMKML
jgi:hypothetical protein